MRTLYLPASLAGVLLLVSGCASSSGEAAGDPREDMGSQFFTAAEIEKSGALTAWEVLRRDGRLAMRENSRGEPESMKLRGRRSLVLNETPLVVVDGVATRDVRILQTIRAETIHWMEILSAAEGASQHGPQAGGGAIVIQTKDGRGANGT